MEGLTIMSKETQGQEVMELTFQSPPETTDESGVVRICEVWGVVNDQQLQGLYTFNVRTGALHITVRDQKATIATGPVLGRLFDAVGGSHAQTH
jgi:hypothetical protein